MIDIAKRLRNGDLCRSGNDLCKVRDARSGCECAIAADEIERLRAALEAAIISMEEASDTLAEYANVLSREPYASTVLDAAITKARGALPVGSACAALAQEKQHDR